MKLSAILWSTFLVLLMTGPVAVPAKEDFVFPQPIYSFIIGSDGDDYLTHNAVMGNGDVLLTGYFSYPVFETIGDGPYSLYQGPFYDINRDQFKEYPVVGDNNSVHYSGSNEIPLTKLSSTGDIIFSKYFGGNGSDVARSIATDSHDNIYLIGETGSSSFWNKSIGITSHGGMDALIMKLSSDGENIFSHTLGGSKLERAQDIAIASDGSVFIVGHTNSEDFPSTKIVGSTNTSLPENKDLFLAKYRSNGSLEFNVRFGGSQTEFSSAIALDQQLNAYVVGYTFSSDFPTVGNTAEFSGKTDGVLSKFSSNGTLLASRYIGGTTTDIIKDVHLTSSGKIVIVGSTYSKDFPIVFGNIKVDDTLNNAEDDIVTSDGFYAIIDPSFQILASSYLGGINSDSLESISFDSEENIYAVGYSTSPDFPVYADYLRPPPFNGILLDDASEGTPNRDLTITKINPAGQIMFSTFFGGYQDDFVYSASYSSINGTDNIILSGLSTSVDFPVTKMIQGAHHLANSFVLDFPVPRGSFQKVLYPGKDNTARNTFFAIGGGLGLLVISIFAVIRFSKLRKARRQHDSYMDRYDLVREAMKKE